VPASMQGEMQPTIYRFKLGGFEVTTIMDSKVIRSGLTPSFGGEANADVVKALAKANRIDADRYEHPFTPVLVNTGKELVLFDTGNGSLREEHEQLKNRLPAGHLVHRMEEAGYKPEAVDVVVITHGHPDHIGGLTRRGQPVFPNARYVFGAAEFDFWNKGENVREARKFNRELYVKIVVPLANRATMIKPGDEVVPGIRAVDAFGHSPGLLAFTIESEGKRMINWADTCNHYVVAIQRPDLHLDVDDDKEKAVATRKRILDMVCKEDLLVAGFHMPFPGLGYVEKAQSGYRWAPHSYQMNL
jgi:glyoxylase-like metal-dependent hydrolase (beta-lactamase superfamily II)